MRTARGVLALVLLAAVAVVIVLGVKHYTSASSNGYMVRAVFDNSSFVIPGEEVKVAGVTVGTIHAVQLTQQNKAAVVLQISNPHFVPFRTDAHCEIGIESLLGEQFVQCTPTQPHAAGVPATQPLPAIGSGSDKGEHLLPVQNTTTPIGFDLLTDINRLPEQERLQLIISGLGAGLAGNGQELNAALQRADPALQQTDKVIAVLASQDRELARLTDESAQVLAPLAAQRQHIGGFVQHVATVATASAREGQAIQQNFRDLPPFLRQLRPAVRRLNGLALQLTPALSSLQAQAPAINSAVTHLGPLAKTSIPAFQTLGNVAQRGETVFPQAHQVSEQLLTLSKPLLPLATDIGAVAQSFDNAGGIEDVMRFIYYYTGSINGEDALGHYIRALVELKQCVVRSPSLTPGCGATFGTTTLGASSASVGSSANQTAAAQGIAALAQPSERTLTGQTPPKPAAPWGTSGWGIPAAATGSSANDQANGGTSTQSTGSPAASSTSTTGTSSSTTASSSTTTNSTGTTAPPTAAGGAPPSTGNGTVSNARKLLDYLLAP